MEPTTKKIYSVGHDVDALRLRLQVFARLPAKRPAPGGEEDGGNDIRPQEKTTEQQSSLGAPSGGGADGSSFLNSSGLGGQPPVHQLDEEGKFLTLMTPQQLSRFEKLERLHKFLEEEILSKHVVPMEDSYFEKLATYNQAVKVREQELMGSPLASDEEYVTSSESDGGQLEDSSFNLEWDDENSPPPGGQRARNSGGGKVGGGGVVIDPHAAVMKNTHGPLAALVEFDELLRGSSSNNFSFSSPPGSALAKNQQDSEYDDFGALARAGGGVNNTDNNRNEDHDELTNIQQQPLDPYRQWAPPNTALMSDPPQGWGAHQSMPLFTKIVHTAPRDVEGKLDEQDWKCYSCDHEWDVDFLESRAIGGIIGLSEYVKFCYYTGKLFCSKCLPDGLKRSVPSRVVQKWDSKALPICKDAAQFLEFSEDEPALCVFVIAPSLLHKCPLLHQGRRIRQQLQSLHLIGLQCPKFRRIFYQQQGQSSSSKKTTTFYIPEDKRYLVEDTEFWSIKDLLEMQKLQPKLLTDEQVSSHYHLHGHTGGGGNGSGGAGSTGAGYDDDLDDDDFSDFEEFEEENPLLEDPCGNSQLFKFLVETRNAMIRHCTQQCTEVCLPRCSKPCYHCKRETPVLEFDILNVAKCSKCGNLYHKPCWQISAGCSFCKEQLAEQKRGKK